jgi:hypothetical protein
LRGFPCSSLSGTLLRVTGPLPLDDDKHGQKIFENLGVQDITPELVTRVCDLLLLRSYFLTHLGPRLAWLIKLSVTEWPTLSPRKRNFTLKCDNLFSPRMSLVLKLSSSTGFGRRSRHRLNLSAPFSSCSLMTMTQPPPVVPLPGNGYLLLFHVQALLSLISLFSGFQ